MITFDVFNNDAFSVTTMLDDMDRQPYRPTGLASFIGFTPEPVSTDTVGVGMIRGSLKLIEPTHRGAPIETPDEETKTAVELRIPRIARGDKLFIHQIANLRPFTGEGDVETVARVVARKQQRNTDAVEYTFEHMMLGALNGIVMSAAGNTIVNFYTAFGITQPGAVTLGLSAASPTPGKLRRDIQSLIVKPIEDAADVGQMPTMRIRAICGSDFFNALVTHPDAEKTYLNTVAAQELRGEMPESFVFGGVEWFRYRGNGAVAVAANQARIFPYGIPDMFQHVMGPCNEMEETINQMGRRYYPVLERDQSTKRQWVQPEIYSYPLFLNRRPDLVLTAQV